MGLDNGIVIRKLTEEQFNQIPDRISLNDRLEEYELCYWRKCWSIRNQINRLIKMGEDEFDKQLKQEDIEGIIAILKKHLNKDYYNDYADTIWSYNEIKNVLKSQIKNLNWLKEFMKTNNNEVFWYDSY